MTLTPAQQRVHALEPHAFVIRTIGGKDAIDGYLVPETNNLLAVDERFDVYKTSHHWKITHLPTGRGIGKLSNQETLEKAVKVAQGFYREFSQLCDLSSKNIDEICAPFNSLPLDKREEIMRRIEGGTDA